MNWGAISAVGEIVGALAVVVSLVYLAVQIRSQNKESRMAAMHEFSVGYRDTLATIADGQMAEIIDKAMDDYDSLTRPESIRLIAGVGRVFRVWEEAYLQFQSGRLDSRTWNSMRRQFEGYISITPFRRVWDIRKQYFDEEFVIFVAETESADTDRAEYIFK